MKRVLWLTLGWTSFGLGTLGIILPLLPTTPFYLLAATAFMKSSKRAYRWMMSNKKIGPIIDQYVVSKTISKKTKFSALITLWVSLSFTMIVIAKPIMTSMLILIGSLVSLIILSHKHENQTTSKQKCKKHITV